MKKLLLAALFAALSLTSCKSDGIKDDGIYARIKTDRGDIVMKLFYEQTPMTVGNFVALAEGTMPNTSKAEGVPFYDGLTFHRVIRDFMIQGGDPTGTGMGDPGYSFPDEIVDSLRHKAGTLSMANSGPNTNGSQFFITEVATDWLDTKHTIFGEVLDSVSLQMVKQIQQNDTIRKIEIIRMGEKAKAWDANKAFSEKTDAFKDAQKAAQDAMEAQLDSLSQGYEKTASGLRYKITQKGKGNNATKGQQVKVHYTGYLTDGTKFDSSYDRKEPLPLTLGIGQVIPGWDEGIALLNKGAKATLIIPPHLAYGNRGAGGVIPPNAILRFDVELVDIAQ